MTDSLPPIHMRIPFLLPHSQTETLRNRTPRPPTPPPGAWRPRYTPREERARLRMLEVGWDNSYCVAGPVFSGFEPTSNVIRHREAAEREARRLRKQERDRQAAMTARGGGGGGKRSPSGNNRATSANSARGRPQSSDGHKAAGASPRSTARTSTAGGRRPVAAPHPSEEQLQRELEQHMEASRLRRDEERRRQERERQERLRNAGTLHRPNHNGGSQSPNKHVKPESAAAAAPAPVPAPPATAAPKKDPPQPQPQPSVPAPPKKEEPAAAAAAKPAAPAAPASEPAKRAPAAADDDEELDVHHALQRKNNAQQQQLGAGTRSEADDQGVYAPDDSNVPADEQPASAAHQEEDEEL